MPRANKPVLLSRYLATGRRGICMYMYTVQHARTNLPMLRRYRATGRRGICMYMYTVQHAS